MENTVVDIQALCRLCMKKQKCMHDIHSEDSSREDKSLAFLITWLTHIPISPDDGFSAVACSQCILQLNGALQFVEQCIETDQKLHQLAEQQVSHERVSLEAVAPEEHDEVTVSEMKYLIKKQPKESERNGSDNDEDDGVFDDGMGDEINNDEVDDETVMDISEDQIETKATTSAVSVILQPETSPTVQDTLSPRKRGRPKKVADSKDQLETEAATTVLAELLLPVVEPTSEELLPPEVKTGRPKKIVDSKNQVKFVAARRSYPKADPKRPYECNVCKTISDTKPNFSAHMDTHKSATKTNHQCPSCLHLYPSLKELEKHLIVLTGGKPFTCELCDSYFSRRDSLKKHLRIHTGELPYACDKCPKRFRMVWSLITHKRTHTGERPYKCDKCGQDYAGSKQLRAHKCGVKGRAKGQAKKAAKRKREESSSDSE